MRYTVAHDDKGNIISVTVQTEDGVYLTVRTNEVTIHCPTSMKLISEVAAERGLKVTVTNA